MQDFHADCTINLLLGAQGNPSKFVWVCSLAQRKGPRLVTARRFVGIVQRERIEWEALLFGLEQALRLQQEKVELCFDAPLVGINEPSGQKLRDPALQALREKAEAMWAQFRLKRASRLDGPEAAYLREEASKAFRRPRERN